MEVTNGIFKAAGQIYTNNRGSILRTIVYTIGHFAIAITVLMLVADVSFMIALTDALVEPIANSIWYFVLDKWWASRSKSCVNNNYSQGYLLKIIFSYLISKYANRKLQL